MEEFYAPISALQHLLVCARQAALIQLDRVWREDRATAQGHVLHSRVDEPGADNRRSVRVLRGVWLSSERFKVTGRADSIELHGASAPFRIVPVEHKRGGGQFSGADAIQLAAQALCLEEMWGVSIVEGSLFYAATRKRLRVLIDETLRAQTAESIGLLHRMLADKKLPPARFRTLCETCSLKPDCLPEAISKPERGSAYLQALLAEACHE
jgi:CRISPR-associated exonuclease Cas4